MTRFAAILYSALLPLACLADALSGFSFHAPASNTAAVVTYAAAAGTRHAISGIAWSYDAAPTAGGLIVRNGAARTVTDGVTATNTTLTSATAVFAAADVGSTVSGTGIVVGTKILSVQSATSVTLNVATTATATGVTVVIDPIMFSEAITSAGAGFFPFPQPRFGTANKVLTVTLAAGGAGVTGKVNVLYYGTQ